MNAIQQAIAKLACRITGHQRDKCVDVNGSGTVRTIQCPRCQGVWSRKARQQTPKGA